jgi:hypothetical protein
MGCQEAEDLTVAPRYGKIFELAWKGSGIFQKIPPENVDRTILDIRFKPVVPDRSGVQQPDPPLLFRQRTFLYPGSIEKKGA